MMANLSERDRKTVRFGGMAAGAIALVMFVLFPVMDYWTSLNKKVDDAKAKIQGIKSTVTDAAASSMEQEKLRTQLTLYPEPASLNRQTAKMLEQIQRLPGYQELSITRVEGMPLRTDEKVVRSGVSVQFSGTLDQLHKLLEQVGAAQPALKVDRLTTATARKNPERVEGQVVISAFAAVTGKPKSSKVGVNNGSSSKV
jgi:Tfp pilus assembly protein PilO